MKKALLTGGLIILFTAWLTPAAGQCSICTKTTQQMGEKPAQGLNSGIIYLAFAPFAIAAYVGYRWWKNNEV
jgi:hypothetical protein